MADFQLLKTVWHHNRVWKPGSEDALQAAGFTREQKKERVRRGEIKMLGARGEPVEPEGPKTLEEHTVAELEDIAKDEGLTGYSSLRKAELVKAIEENRAAVAEGSTETGDEETPSEETGSAETNEDESAE